MISAGVFIGLWLLFMQTDSAPGRPGPLLVLILLDIFI